MEEGEAMDQDVSGIIETLDEEEAMKTPSKNPPPPEYSAYVADDDEISQVAMNAAMEIAGLDDLQPLVYDDTSNDGSSPLKLRSSPKKAAAAAPRTPVKTTASSPAAKRGSPRKSLAKTVTPMKKTPIKNATPSKSRSPVIVKQTLAKSSEAPTPKKKATPAKSTSPSKTAAVATPEATKLTRRTSSRTSSGGGKSSFPIFGKGTAKSGLEQGKKTQTPSRSSKRSLGKLSSDQMLLDAGQKKIGSHPCEMCGFLYTRGDSDAEKVHDKFHKQYLGVVSFAGWKTERVIKEDTEMR